MEYSFKSGTTGFSINQISIIPVSREKNYRHSFMEGRPCHAFIYTESGRMLDEFTFPNNERIITEPGTLLFAPKGAKYYGTYLEDDTRLKTIQFDIESGELPDYLRAPKRIDLKNVKSVISSFFNSSANHVFHYVSLLYDLLWQIDSHYATLPQRFTRLNAALEDISVYPERNEKISYYADMCYMSEVNFRRLFREHMGKSPIEYRNDLRLEKARALIQSGEYNVSESAEAVGFSNLSFFIRLYKKRFGRTPKNEA